MVRKFKGNKLLIKAQILSFIVKILCIVPNLQKYKTKLSISLKIIKSYLGHSAKISFIIKSPIFTFFRNRKPKKKFILIINHFFTRTKSSNESVFTVQHNYAVVTIEPHFLWIYDYYEGWKWDGESFWEKITKKSVERKNFF